MSDEQLDWISVGKEGDWPQGRVKTVAARTVSICQSHFDGKWAVMNNQRGTEGRRSAGEAESAHKRTVTDLMGRNHVQLE